MSTPLTPLTSCGRPGILDLSKYARTVSGEAQVPLYDGDLNYGIVTNGSSFSIPNISNQPIQGIPPGWYNPPNQTSCAGSGNLECPVASNGSGCSYPGIPSACLTTEFGTGSLNFFPGTWPQRQTLTSIVSCCTDQASDTGTCAPDQCAESPGVCQEAMKSVCLGGGPNTNWEYPLGTSPQNLGYRGACDAYVSATAGVPYTPTPGGTGGTCPSSPSASTTAEDFISTALCNYFTYGGKVTDDTYFASKIPSMCSQYPGLCDSILQGQCSSFTLDQLNPSSWASPSRQYDPQGLVPLQICGCFLPPSKYVPGLPVECQSSCSFPGVIPMGSGIPSKPAKQCAATQCVIDNITANYIDTTGGGINIKQVCGQCSSDQPCACYFSDVAASGVADPSISTNCQTCFNYDSTSGLSSQVPCPGSIPSPSGKWFYIGLGVAAFFLVGYFIWRVANRKFS